MTDWADDIVAGMPRHYPHSMDGEPWPIVARDATIAQALRDVHGAEIARCLAIVRRVMDTTVTGSDAVYAVMRIAELIEGGEPV